MVPLFDKDRNFVGWLVEEGRRDIFDGQMNWVAFVWDDDHIWAVGNKKWVGVLYGSNVLDVNGKVAFWNPDTVLENLPRPVRPLAPAMPLRPTRPLRPASPLRPPSTLSPAGGWSGMSWDEFVKGGK